MASCSTKTFYVVGLNVHYFPGTCSKKKGVIRIDSLGVRIDYFSVYIGSLGVRIDSQ